MLRLMREGHSCDWYLFAEERNLKRVLRGMIPEPLKNPPSDFSIYDLIIFDNTANPDEAEECRKYAPVIGGGVLNSKLEDDRLFGIQVMESCGIEVPRYETFNSPDEARNFLEEFPRRYVYKPFTPESGEDQPSDVTYVSESAEDMEKCLDSLFKDSLETPFLLQEFVEGIECAANGYFDGSEFHFLTHTIEEKKFMDKGYGPNTGCSGNLIYCPNGKNRLLYEGILKLTPFLREHDYRGMIDLNTIVNEEHVFGLEFTPRFGYDSSASEFAMLNGDLGMFLYNIATGAKDFDPCPPIRHAFSASARYTIPPYPEEDLPATRGLPVKGIDTEKAWKYYYLWDAMLEDEQFVTAGINGLVVAPIATGLTPKGAWEGVERLSKHLKIPNLQVRTDLEESTIKRFNQVKEMGWL